LTKTDIIKTLAEKLRAAILATPREERPISLRDFPHGSCGDATLLLGTYLSEHGLGDFMYISAARSTPAGGIWTHGWAEQDELIVDITACQFPEIQATVIVDSNSSWHATFERKESHRAHINAFDGPEMPALRRYYARLKEKF
jgi:hypothetical protein